MYIKLRVVTDSKFEKVEKLKDDTFKVFVKAPAERGLANSRVVELMSDLLKTKNIRIISGHTSPSKIISVD